MQSEVSPKLFFGPTSFLHLCEINLFIERLAGKEMSSFSNKLFFFIFTTFNFVMQLVLRHPAANDIIIFGHIGILFIKLVAQK